MADPSNPPRGLVLLGRMGAEPPEVCDESAWVSTATGQRFERVLDQAATLYVTRSHGWWREESGAIAWNLLRRPEVAEDAAILQASATEAQLHGDEAGVLPIYYHVDARGTAWFSNDLSPLVEVVPGDLHVDWQAWGDIIQTGHPLGDRTPFEEIRRLLPDQMLRSSERGVRCVPRAWSWKEAPERLSVQEIIDGVVATVRSSIAQLDTEVTVPLSGGWDSRLLLACTDSEQVQRCFTVDTDAGDRIEQRYAEAIAVSRGVLHERHPPDHDRPYAEDAITTAERLGYETSLHPWFLDVVAGAARGDGTVLDGLGGLLLKPSYSADQPLEGDEDQLLDALWRKIAPGSGSTQVLAHDAANGIRSTSRDRVRDLLQDYRGHPAAGTLIRHTTRLVRGLGLATTQLLAPVAPVSTPLTATPTAQLLLALEPEFRLSGRFYPELLRAADPVMAELPSTNDKVERPPPVLSRRELHPDTQRWYVDLLSDDVVRSLLAPSLLLRLRSGRTAGLFAYRRQRYAIRGVALLSAWLRRYEDRLADLEPPEVWRPPRMTAGDAPRRQPDAWLREVRKQLNPVDWLGFSWQGGLSVEGTGQLDHDLDERGRVVLAAPDGSVGMVLVDDVFDLVDTDTLAAEVRRVLRTDGLLAVSLPWPTDRTPSPDPEDIFGWATQVAHPTSIRLKDGRFRIVADASAPDARGTSLAPVLTLAYRGLLQRGSGSPQPRAATSEVDELAAWQARAKAAESELRYIHRTRWWRARDQLARAKRVVVRRR